MIKKFIEKIRNSDEKTKKKWLIIFSAAAMVVVVLFWLVYINNFIESIGGDKEAESSGIGFWDIFKNGLKVTIDSIAEKIKLILGQINSERTIIIEPK